MGGGGGGGSPPGRDHIYVYIYREILFSYSFI